jgi:Holliday junction resolvase
MTRYDNGARFERETAEDLRKRGYVAERIAGSHSPADVHALKSGVQPIFVQCKKSGVLPPKEWNAFYDYCEKAGARPIMAMKPGRGIAYFELLERKEKRGKQPMKGVVIE